MQNEQLAEHGGESGVRNQGLLASALAQPRQRLACGSASLAELGASLADGLCRNHPFVDGNKRTSLVVAEHCLHINDTDLVASDEECVVTFLKLASGELPEDQLVTWVAAHCE